MKLDGNFITPNHHVKSLGLYIDKHMNFDVHDSELIEKVIGTLVYINRLSNNFQKPTRTVPSLVLSH